MKHSKLILCLGLILASLVFAAPKKQAPVDLRSIAQNDAALLEKANEYYRMGRFNLAIPLYRKLEDRAAFPLQTSFNLGNSYFQLGDLPRAAAAYRKASSLGEAENPTVLFNLGAVLYRLGQYGEAVATYHRALRLEPENTNAWLYLSESYQRTGDLVGAQKALEKVLSLGEPDVAAVYQLSEIFVQQKNYTRAIQVAKDGLARFPAENDLWFYIGDLERLNRNPDGALASYRQGMLNSPKNYEVLYKMADVASSSKKIPMAMDYLEKAIAIKPDFGDALIFLGNLAYELKWRDRAFGAYLRAAKLGNAEGIQGIINLALDLQQENRPKEALAWLVQVEKIPATGTLANDRKQILSQLRESN